MNNSGFLRTRLAYEPRPQLMTLKGVAGEPRKVPGDEAIYTRRNLEIKSHVDAQVAGDD